MTSNKTKLPILNTNENTKDSFDALLIKGTPLYLTYGLTEKHLDLLFSEAYSLYAEEKYLQALSNFTFMTILNHFDKRGWIGSGVCWQVLKNYNSALTCYSRASLIDVQDPLPIFHSIECYIALKNYSDALASLEVIKPLIKDKPEFDCFKNTLAKTEEFLKKA